MRRGWMSLVGVSLAACGARVSSVARPNLMGGDNLRAGSPGFRSAVVLRHTRDGERRKMFCTGTLIAPRLVLTAAHCIDSQISDFEIEFPAIDGMVSSQFVKVKKYRPHERYRTTGRNWDVGLVLLESDAPSAYQPEREFLTDVARLSVGSSFVLVGAGKQGFAAAAEGVRQRLERKLGRVMAVSYFHYGLEFPADSSGLGACPGDSGGPAFASVGGKPVLAGIANSATCGNGGSWYTFAGSYAKWLERTGRELTGLARIGFSSSVSGPELSEALPEFTTLPNQAARNPQFECRARGEGDIEKFSISFTTGSYQKGLWADLAMIIGGRVEYHVARFGNSSSPQAVNAGPIESGEMGLTFVFDESSQSGIGYDTGVSRQGRIQPFSCKKLRPVGGVMTAVPDDSIRTSSYVAKNNVAFPDENDRDVCFVPHGKSIRFADYLGPVGDPKVVISGPIEGCRYRLTQVYFFDPAWSWVFDN